jgi:IMP dehydrogenase
MTVLQSATTVADLMTIDPIVVGADASLDEAESLMRENHVTGLPVVDAAGFLVGVISETDFLYLADPEVKSLIRLPIEQIRIRDVMSHPAVTVSLATTLVEAARVMTVERVHRLVAVDSDRRPVGILSAMDFVALHAEG